MSETRAEQIARWEREGWLDPNCAGCLVFYRHPDPPFTLMEPRHQSNPNCESGRQPHCTCDRCW